MLHFLGKPKQIAVVEWGEGEIRLSLPSRTGRMTATLLLTNLPEEQGFEVSRRLKELANRGALSSPLCVVLPSQVCTFKLMKLPAESIEAREQIWRNEAANQLGLPLTEIELAFLEQPDGVLVAAVRKSFLHTYLAPFVQLDLPIRWVIPSVVGLWISVRKPPSGNWGILELRGNKENLTGASIALGLGNRLRVVHSISLNGSNGEWMVSELRRTIALYQRTYGETVEQIFVIGNRHFFDKFMGDKVLPTMEELTLEAEGNTPFERALSAIAVAVASAPSILSFPPPEREPALIWRRIEERLVGALAVLAFAGIIAGFAISSQVKLTKEQINAEQEVLSRQKRELKRLTSDNFSQKVQSFEQIWQRLKEPRNDPLELLYWLSKSLPTSLWVTEIVFLKDSQVILRGNAVSHSAVTDAVRVLSELEIEGGKPLFAEVMTNYANAKTLADKTLVEFQITAWLRERTTTLRQRQVLRP